MRDSYILSVEAGIMIADAADRIEAASLLTISIKIALAQNILTGIRPRGAAGVFTFRQPDDTWIIVERLPCGKIVASLTIH